MRRTKQIKQWKVQAAYLYQTGKKKGKKGRKKNRKEAYELWAKAAKLRLELQDKV